MKIRSATFFHEQRSGKESGKETVFSLSAMLAKNKGQPPMRALKKSPFLRTKTEKGYDL